MSTDNSTADNTTAFAKLTKAEGDYNLETAQGQLALAQASVQDAEARREDLGNEEYQLRIDRLRHQQIALRDAERKAAGDLANVNDHLHRVSQLVASGKTNRYIFDSIYQLLVILNEPETVLKVMGATVPLEACGYQNNFRNNSEMRPKLNSTLDFNGSSVGQLIEFLKTNRLELVPFSGAHMAVVEAFSKLSEAAETKATATEAKVTELRDHVEAPLPTPAGNADAEPSSNPTPGPIADPPDSAKAPQIPKKPSR
jgi:hypothetical protein